MNFASSGDNLDRLSDKHCHVYAQPNDNQAAETVPNLELCSCVRHHCWEKHHMLQHQQQLSFVEYVHAIVEAGGASLGKASTDYDAQRGELKNEWLQPKLLIEEDQRESKQPRSYIPKHPE